MPGEKVVLVERLQPDRGSLLRELRSLAEAAGYEVAGEFVQRRKEDSRYQVGHGKALEITDFVRANGVGKIIFENELKPVQAYNLAKLARVPVVDKFQLILEVFNQHASTREARLQIKLAGLKYELARAREKVRLAKLGEQPGFHGLGKYEVDVYFEAVKSQASRIEEALRAIRKKKGMLRNRRFELGYPLVSLAGYTMSGKSTLFNALTGGQMPVTGKPFTTLATKAGLVDLLGKRVLLSDTVGFIDNLSIKLIEAFRSTLEEMLYSSLVLLVVDCSESVPEVERKLRCCLRTLRDIGVTSTPIITVFNKLDLIGEKERTAIRERLSGLTYNHVFVSALKGFNLEKLKTLICSEIKYYVRATFELPLSGDTLSFISRIRRHSTVLAQEYGEKTVRIHVEAADYLMDRIRNSAENFGGRMICAQAV